MFRPKKFVLTSLTVFMIAALTSCNLGQPAQPTTPTVDLTAIGTTIAATVQAELTLNAPTAAPTSTITVQPSETLGGATNTPGIVPIEETSAITPTGTLLLGDITATPSLTPIGGATAIPSFTPILVVGGSTAVGPVCKNAAFGGDLDGPTDVQDGDVLEPWQKFTKGWMVVNTGTCVWDEGFSFRGWIGPPSMTDDPIYIQDKAEFVEGNGGILIARAKMYAPGDPGEYVAHWQMYDDAGKPFGGDFTAFIKVVK